MLKKVFSIINDKKNSHKIITILGLKLKFKTVETLQQKLKLQEIAIKRQNINLKKQAEKIKILKESIAIFRDKQKKKELEFDVIKAWYKNFYKDTPEIFPIKLSLGEKEMLIEYYKNSKNYLEFGSGGSTFIALLNSTCNIYSVESDYEWLNFLRTYRIIYTNENKRLTLKHIDIGKIKGWGYPFDNSKRKNYPDYSTGFYKDINSKDLDIVFIDGRFRVACALGVILNCPKNIKILIHDYSKRKQYHILEEFLDVTEKTDTLYAFKIKDNVNTDKVKELYEEYKYITK